MGISKYVAEQLKHREYIDSSILYLIMKEGFETGSTVYSDAYYTETDNDIVYYDSCGSLSFLLESGYLYKYVVDASSEKNTLGYYGVNNFYCKSKSDGCDLVYNIMSIKDKFYYDAWCYTTSIMRELYQKGEDFNNKDKRVATFKEHFEKLVKV